METVIVICLLLVIALLLPNKIVKYKETEKKPKREEPKVKLPNIMGQPKLLRNLSMPKNATGSQDKNLEAQTDNFDIEIDEDLEIQVQQEELNDVFRNIPDLEQEEEEWNRYGISGGDDGFAQGVTLEELSSVGMLLQKEKLEPSQQETAIAIVQKIQGTELFSMLENSIESASHKIVALLDGRLSENEIAFSTLRKDDLNDFDIGDFV